MNKTRQADIERLVRGERLEAETFMAIMTDPEAVRLVQQFSQVQQVLFDGPGGHGAEVDNSAVAAGLPAQRGQLVASVSHGHGRGDDSGADAAMNVTLPPQPQKRWPWWFLSCFAAAAALVAIGYAVWTAEQAARTNHQTRQELQQAQQERDLAVLERDQAAAQAEQDRKQVKAFEQEIQSYRVAAQDYRTKVTPRTAVWFREEFDRNRAYKVKLHDKQPGRVDLLFNPFMGDPYFVGLQLAWAVGDKETGQQLVFYTGHKQLEQVITLDFTDQLAGAGERVATIFLRFHPTPGSMKMLGLGPVVEEKIPLIVSQSGIRIASQQDGDLIVANVGNLKDGQKVNEHFSLDLTLRRLAQEKEGGGSGVVHVLFRPLDGYAKLREQYFVVPFRKRAEELSDREWTQRIGISLQSILASLPANEPAPTQFKVLVVVLPFERSEWAVPRSQLSLGAETLGNQVRAFFQVVLAPAPVEP